MKIALVNPPPINHRERYDLPVYPHLGLGYIAAGLEQKGFHDLKVVDAKLARKNTDTALLELASFQPDIVGITAMTHEIIQASKFADKVKGLLPHCIITVGGVHVSVLPQQTLEEFSSFDYGIINEGEKSFPLLVETLSKEGELDKVANLVYRNNGTVQVNPVSDWIHDLDVIPFPAWNHFPPAMEYPVLSARGCPFQCNFCNPNGRKIRERTPENVMEEIEWVLSTYKPEQISMYDETFGVNRKRVFKLLDLMMSHDVPQRVKWFATTRVNIATEELLRTMKEAGAFRVGFGVETGNREILKRSQKNIDLNRAEELVAFAKKCGLETEVYFILGHPYETLETINDTINFAVKLNGDLTSFGIMVPYPGTKIYEMAKRGEAGYRLIAGSWNDYNKQLGNALEFTNIPRKKIERLQMFAYIKVFLKNHRYLDFLKFCWDFRRQAFGFVEHHFLNKK